MIIFKKVYEFQLKEGRVITNSLVSANSFPFDY